MQFQKKGKKDEKNPNTSSQIQEINITVPTGTQVTQGMTQQSYQRGREYNTNPIPIQEYEKSTTESGFRDIIFLDPNDNLRRTQNMSPITEGRTLGMSYIPGSRSPLQRQSVISNVRNDLNERSDTAKIVGKKPIPTLTVSLPFRTDGEVIRGDRSPKVINLAGDKDQELYSTKSLINRRSPHQKESSNMYNYGLQTMKENDLPGNILEDRPITGSFIQVDPNIHRGFSQNENIIQGSFIQPENLNKYDQRATTSYIPSHYHPLRDPREKDREILFINQTHGRETLSQSLGRETLNQKMSPNRNEDNFPYNQNQSNIEKIRGLKEVNQTMDRSIGPNDPRKREDSRDYENKNNSLDNIEYNIKTNKRGKSVKGYDKNKKEGKLVSNLARTYEAEKDGLMKERHQVLQRMNKLSLILLSKSQDPNKKGSNIDEENQINYNRNTLRKDDQSTYKQGDRKNFVFSRSPQEKFIRITMAMLSSKGPNCEDRIITRVMRSDKGGVVDFHQSSIVKKKKYEVKQPKKGKIGQTSTPNKPKINNKDRGKASKIIQAWWREILNRYKSVVHKITKIQSVWRGHWLRTYLYDILYSTLLCQHFIDKSRNPLVKYCRRKVGDILFGPYREKHEIQKKLNSILKIQRQAKKFLNKLRDNKSKLPLLLDKILERKKIKAFNKLKDEADNPTNKNKKALNNTSKLIDLSKKFMRIRLFHGFLFSAFNRPINKLKSVIFRNSLRGKLNKMNHLFVREYFMRWLKNALKNKLNDKAKENGIKNLFRSIAKPKFNDVKNTLKKLPPKNLKEKLLKTLLKKADRYQDVALRHYLRLWSDKIRKEKISEFQNVLFGKFLFKTKHRLNQNFLKSKFNKWRGKKINKKNLVPFMNGLEHLENHVRRNVYNKIMPIDSCIGLKSRLWKSIFHKSNKFKLVPLRYYYDRWKKFISKARNSELCGIILKNLGNNVFSKFIRSLLLKKFLDWRRRANILAYLYKFENDDKEKRKYFGLTKLLNGTHRLAKRKALHAVMDPIKRYLDDIIRQQATKKLLFMNPRLSKILLKNYWNKYKKQINNLRKKEVRNKFFEVLTNKSGSNFRNKILRRYLFKWWRNLPKGMNIRYYQGSEFLLQAIWRKKVKNPIEAFKHKVDLESAHDGVIRALGLKNKYIQRHWRKYLYKWKKNCDALKTKEIKGTLCGKLMDTLLNKFKSRILSNRFSHWRKVPKINMKDIFDRFKNMSDFSKKVALKAVKPRKKEFFEGVKKHVGNQAYKKALKLLANLAINGNNIKLKQNFDKWRYKVKDFIIYDLKKKCLQLSISNQGIKNKKKLLSAAFHHWLRNIKLDNLLKNSNKHLNFMKGLNTLEKLKKNKQNDLVTRLKLISCLDARGNILFQIYKRLQRPRYSISRAFDKWRRIKDNHNKNEMVKNYCTRLVNSSCKKVTRRQLRDKFLKCFHLWKNLIKKPEDYYIRIADGNNKTNNFLKNKCRDAFNKLSNFKNYKKLFTSMLPPHLKLKENANKASLLRSWNKWKKDVSNGRVLKYNGLLVNKLCKNMSKRRDNNNLSNAFHKWAGIKKKSLHFPKFVEGLNKIRKTLQNPWSKQILDKLNNNYQAKAKKSGLNCLFLKSKTYQNHKLRSALIKWWKNHLLINENLKNKILRNLKRILVENYILSPKEKYFRRWLINMIEKPKNAKDYIDGTDKLKKYIKQKHFRTPFTLLKKHCAPEALTRALFHKILPNAKKLNERYKKLALGQWKRNVDRLKIKEARLKLLNSLYGKGKTALHKRFLKEYFNRWAYVKKPIDLANMVEGEKKIFRTLVKKLFTKDFYPCMKTYGNNRFLKSLLLKNSKFHQKALEPFFNRWKDKANKLKEKQIKADLAGKLVAKTRIYKNRQNIRNLLKNKFDQWRNNIKNYDKKVEDAVPKVQEILRKNRLKNLFPELIKPMKTKALKSKKKQKLNNGLETGSKVLFNHQRNAFYKWKDQLRKLAIRDLRNKTMQHFLKLFTKKVDKEKLLRCFLFWKGGLPKLPGNRGVMVGTDTVKRLLQRNPWQKFKKKTKMMNLKIPYGMSLSECLIRMNPNVAKSLAIRNMTLRPYFKNWKKQINKLKTQELQANIFNKLVYPNSRNFNRLLLRKALNRWRDIIDDENKRNLQKDFHSKILQKIYNRNSTLWLRIKYNQWKENTKAWHKYLNNVALGVVKIKHDIRRKTLWNLYRKFFVPKHSYSKLEMVKKILINALRNSDKGNLVYCFSRWKKNKYNQRELALKHKIIKNLICKHENKNEESDKNYLHEKFLLWRIRCVPHDYLDRINKIRVGAHTLHKGLTKRFNRDVFNKTKALAKLNKINEMMYKMIGAYDQKADIFLLKIFFKRWRARLPDTNLLRRKLYNFFNDHVNTSEPAHYTLIKKPTDALIESMKSWVAFKTKKANDIQSYCRGIFNILQRVKLVKRNKNVHKIWSKLNFKTAIKARLCFVRWLTNAKLITKSDNAFKIQKYLRGKQDALTKKRNKISNGADHLDKFVKKKIFNDLYYNGLLFRKRQLLLRLMKDLPEEVRLEFLKRYLLRWRAVNQKVKEHAANSLISRVTKGFLTRKFKNLLLKRRARLNECVKKLFLKHLDKKRIYFNKWVIDTRIDRCSKAGQIIQAFIGNKLLDLKLTRAKIRLLQIFRQAFIKKLHNAMKKAASIQGNRAQIMNETIKNIFFQRPFDKLKDGSKWIGRFKKLHHVYPRIIQGLRKYWLPFYLKKWKEKTWDYKMNKLIGLQNWIKARLILWKLRTDQKKNDKLTKFLMKATKDNDLKKRLVLKNWSKKAKLDNLHKKASHVQALWKGNTSRKATDRELNRLKLKNILKKNLIKNICSDLTKCSDFIEPLKRNLKSLNGLFGKRYTTNNLIDFANDTLRNHYFWRLTEKNSFRNNLTLLREYFNRFKLFGDAADKHAKNLQTKYRQFVAKKNLAKLLRMKDRLYKIFGKYDDSEKGRLKTSFHRWNNIAALLALNDKAKTIQNYLKVKNARWQNTKFKNFFLKGAENLIKKRINNASKVNKLRNVLRKHAIKVFVERIHNKTRYNKLFWIFCRRFADMDDQMRALYKRKYLRDWNDNARKVKNKMNAAAFYIINLWKGHLVRKFVGNLLAKKNKIFKIMLKLTNDSDLKKALYFRLWNNITRSDKVQNSAQVLQKFMSDCKEKNEKLKNHRRLMKVKEGSEKLDDTWKKAAPSNALYKIKSHSNRNKVNKLGDDVETKKKNHLLNAYNKIIDFGDKKHGNKLKATRKIQQDWRNYLKKKAIWNLITKVKRLRFILKIMLNRNLRLLNKAFRLWGKNAMGDDWHNNAKKIQAFLNDKVLNWRRKQGLNAKSKLKKLCRDYYIKGNVLPFLKNLTNAIKLDKFKDLIGRFILKKFRDNVFNYEKLKCIQEFADNINKANEDLTNKNSNLFLNKLYRLYIFKVLDNLAKKLKDFQKKVIKPIYSKQLIDKLHDNKVAGSKENYLSKLKSSKPPKIKQSTFKSFVQSIKKIVPTAKEPLKRVVPVVTNLLENIRKSKILNAYNKLKDNQRANKLCDLIKKIIDKKLPKKDFLTKISNRSDYNKETPELLKNLQRLLRRYFIHQLYNNLIPVSKIHKMLYLIRLTFMHREVSGKRFLRELVRRWRFCIFMRKLAKKKMENLYKNMHLSLLNMAKEIFGDGEGNDEGSGSNSVGMINEFESFGNSLGMFTNEDISVYDELKKKFYVQVNKKYQFEPIEKLEEESHNDENLVPEYYYDGGIGDGTHGRYQQDTNQSVANEKKTKK